MIDRLYRQIIFFAPCAVMSAWAVVLLHTVASGRINRYLSPMFHPYVLTAGLALLVLSVLHLLLYQPGSDPSPPGRRLRQLARWFLLLVPVVAASVLSPAGLSSTTGHNRGDPTPGTLPMPSINPIIRADIKDAITADPNQPVPVEVTDLVTVANSPDQIKQFAGRKVRVTGLFANDGGTLELMRWIMWCCAADAKPVSVLLDGNTAGGWKNDDWIEVTGTVQFPSTLGHAVPQIEVDGIKPTQEPDEPYLSP